MGSEISLSGRDSSSTIAFFPASPSACTNAVISNGSPRCASVGACTLAIARFTGGRVPPTPTVTKRVLDCACETTRRCRINARVRGSVRNDDDPRQRLSADLPHEFEYRLTKSCFDAARLQNFLPTGDASRRRRRVMTGTGAWCDALRIRITGFCLASTLRRDLSSETANAALPASSRT